MAGETVICSAAKCSRPAHTRGMCKRCYLRWWKATPRQLRPEITAVERFLAKVNQNGPTPAHAPELGPCWEWTGSRRPSGHGQFNHSVERGTLPAQVFALEIATGEPCPAGKAGLHRCDNPPCCRPSHIYFGTRAENAEDAWARNRHPVGSERAAARLTEDQVEEIRIRYAAGETGSGLATEFGLQPCSIYGITSGQKWPNAAGPITRRRAA